jgi:hypothetical protein
MIGMSVCEEMILSGRRSVVFGRAASAMLNQAGFQCRASSNSLMLPFGVLIYWRLVDRQRKWNKLVRGPRSEAIDPNTRELQNVAVCKNVDRIILNGQPMNV